jgi:prepilin-type N-terminal cleavage/methylation domain-containing protein
MHPAACRSSLHDARGFTLVELLAAITIIVVLLALLLPAISRAVYQTTLAHCSSNQKSVAMSMIAYATDHDRRYPFRDLPTEGQITLGALGGIQAHKITHLLESGSGIANYDLRPMLSPYIQINKMLNDPFVEPVDLEKAEAMSGGPLTINIYSSLFLWGGWQFWGEERMERVGDRFTYTTSDKKMAFNLLVGDIDSRSGGQAYSSHPDMKYLSNRPLENGPNPFGGPMTVSQWHRQGDAFRNPLDLNFTYDDGSVRRFNSVDYVLAGDSEAGMVRIPNYNNESDTPNHVPDPAR